MHQTKRFLASLALGVLILYVFILSMTVPTAQSDVYTRAMSSLPPTLILGDYPRTPTLLDAQRHPIWKAPALTLLAGVHQQTNTWRLALVPTGTETDACVYTVTVTWSPPTWQVTTHTVPCPMPPDISNPPPLSKTLPIPQTALSSQDVLSPPAIIRVRHDPRNTCRDVPPWHVDIIPFEEYVSRVLPAEMPALWPMETLKAQAIAIRTYAWYHILHPHPDYDVSDWVDNQVMCDQHHPRSDLAVQTTRGQILVHNGEPIVAFYSAQNGHPTADDPWGLPYIVPVPDPVSLGDVRWGHGWGLSQVGAARWAERGWNAYQILAHYYPGTSLAVPPDTTTPVGTLLPPELENMTLGQAYPLYFLLGSVQTLRALTVKARIGDNPPIVVLSRTRFITPFLGIWDPPPTLSSTKPIRLDVYVEDISRTVTSLGGTRLYRTPAPPTLTVNTVTETVEPRISLEMDINAAPESAPRVGIGEGWLWEETAFSWMPKEAGRVISDTQALNGRAWQHPLTATNSILYGPYTSRLRPGQSYRAWFRLTAGDVRTSKVVAFLDVVEDTGRTLLGLRALRGIEFPAAGVYREFPVDFHLFGSPRRVEFRVHALAPITLTLDRVLVTTYPQAKDDIQQWPLEHRPGVHTLTLKVTDRGGKVGTDTVIPITLDMPTRPLTFTFHAPRGWVTTTTPITWTLRTAVAPPNPARFAYRYSRDQNHWSSWLPLQVGDIYSRGGTLSLSPAHLPDAASVWVQVRGEDAFTYAAESAPISLSVDLHPPIAQVTMTLHRDEIYVRWGAEDANGVTGYDVDVQQEGTGWRRWFTHTVTTEGLLESPTGTCVAVRVRAYDHAGWIGPWSTPMTVTVPYHLWTPHIFLGSLNDEDIR